MSLGSFFHDDYVSSEQQKFLLQDIGSGFQPEKYNLKYPKPIFEEKEAQILLFFFTPGK